MKTNKILTGIVTFAAALGFVGVMGTNNVTAHAETITYNGKKYSSAAAAEAALKSDQNKQMTAAQKRDEAASDKIQRKEAKQGVIKSKEKVTKTAQQKKVAKENASLNKYKSTKKSTKKSKKSKGYANKIYALKATKKASKVTITGKITNKAISKKHAFKSIGYVKVRTYKGTKYVKINKKHVFKVTITAKAAKNVDVNGVGKSGKKYTKMTKVVSAKVKTVKVAKKSAKKSTKQSKKSVKKSAK